MLAGGQCWASPKELRNEKSFEHPLRNSAFLALELGLAGPQPDLHQHMVVTPDAL